MNDLTIEKIRFENIPNITQDLLPEFEPLVQHKNNGDWEIKDFRFENLKQKWISNESALILINAVGMFLPYC